MNRRIFTTLSLLALLLAGGVCLGQPLAEPVAEPVSSPDVDPSQGEAVALIRAERADREPLSLIDVLDFEGLLKENTLNQWMVLLTAIFVGLLFGRVVSTVLRRVSEKFEARGWTGKAHVLGDLAGPANLAIFTLGLGIGMAQLRMGPELGLLARKVILLLYLSAAFWYAFNLVSVIELTLIRMGRRTRSPLLDGQIVPIVRKALRIFLMVIAVLVIFERVFEQDVGAWLAGLGIIGLAVSLAAQDSIKNLFGSLTIIFDQPFKVGERISYSGYEGHVEHVGFRSTKLRTLTGHLVTVPNLKIVNDPVENVGRRPYIRRRLDVTITYDTPREKIEQAVRIIREILEEPGIAEAIHGQYGKDELPPRVAFSDFNADSLNILVFYWHFPPDYWQFLAHAQKVNLRIFEEFEQAGIDFAFPTQTVHLAGDPKRELAMRMLGADLKAIEHGGRN